VGRNVDTSVIKGIITDMVLKDGDVYVRADGVDVRLDEVKKALAGAQGTTVAD
jgi:hypothetical protein